MYMSEMVPNMGPEPLSIDPLMQDQQMCFYHLHNYISDADKTRVPVNSLTYYINDIHTSRWSSLVYSGSWPEQQRYSSS